MHTYTHQLLTHLPSFFFIVNKPVAAASHYKFMIDSVFSILLGIDPEYKTLKTNPAGSNPKGIFGHTRAVYLCTEVQGRLALHGHASIWAGVPPDIIQVMVQWKEGLSTISKVMESYIQCHIPPVYHLKRTAMYATKPSDRKEQGLYETTRPIYKDLQDTLAYDIIYDVINMTANVHEHNDTCKKLPHGELSCRLAYPQEATHENMKIVEIVQNTETKQDCYVSREDFKPIEIHQRNIEQQP